MPPKGCQRHASPAGTGRRLLCSWKLIKEASLMTSPDTPLQTHEYSYHRMPVQTGTQPTTSQGKPAASKSVRHNRFLVTPFRKPQGPLCRSPPPPTHPKPLAFYAQTTADSQPFLERYGNFKHCRGKRHQLRQKWREGKLYRHSLWTSGTMHNADPL